MLGINQLLHSLNLLLLLLLLLLLTVLYAAELRIVSAVLAPRQT
jgi:hypothetical protein